MKFSQYLAAVTGVCSTVFGTTIPSEVAKRAVDMGPCSDSLLTFSTYVGGNSGTSIDPNSAYCVSEWTKSHSFVKSIDVY